MKKLLIVKTGKTLKSVIEKVGDFEDLIINKTSLRIDEVIIYKPFKNDDFPEMNRIKGIIITGSHSMVTDDLPWIKSLSKWLKYSIDEFSIPVLGLCFGHQLLAKICGGQVDYHPIKKEIGSREIFLTEEGRKNRLFKGFPDKFTGYLIHEQSVLRLPSGAKRLAYNNFENNQAFYLKDNIWGVQFHPEFTFEVIKEYILNDKDELSKNGFKPSELIENLHRDTLGKKLIKNFLEIINNKKLD